MRFENAKTHTIRRCRLVYSTATTSAAHRRDPDTHEMRGVWRGGRNGLQAPRQHLRRSAFLIRIYIIHQSDKFNYLVAGKSHEKLDNSV